ncbi:MAG TPA: thioredoxin domain-containing protein [Acidimicrobiales bacterium]
MERVVLVVVLAVVAVAIATVVQRRQRPPAPTATGYVVPDHLDRADFTRPDAPWLVAVFTSATCNTCAGVWEKAKHLASDAVAVQELEVKAEAELHRKYSIGAVPATLVADAEGAVQAKFLGPVTATDLWATLAELRAPGTLPADGCDHGAN